MINFGKTLPFAGLIGSFLILTACASTIPLGGKDPTGPQAVKIMEGELPPPVRGEQNLASNGYVIGPYDKMSISVFGMEELDQKEIQADANGNISFPLAGVIEAGGKLPSEVSTMIASRLRANYIRNPKVTVNVTEILSQRFTVDGEVKEPGLYPSRGRMTLMSAVASAKGVSENAKLEDVVVFRTVEGQRMAALYNLKSIRRGIYADPQIYPNDIVVVGNSAARGIFKDILQVAPVLGYVAVTLLK